MYFVLASTGPTLLDFLAKAVSAGVVRAALAARAWNHKLFEIFRRACAVTIRRRIVVVRVHGPHAERRAVAAEGTVRSGCPAPGDVHARNATGKRSAPGDRLNIGRYSPGWNAPRYPA